MRCNLLHVARQTLSRDAYLYIFWVKTILIATFPAMDRNGKLIHTLAFKLSLHDPFRLWFSEPGFEPREGLLGGGGEGSVGDGNELTSTHTYPLRI